MTDDFLVIMIFLKIVKINGRRRSGTHCAAALHDDLVATVNASVNVFTFLNINTMQSAGVGLQLSLADSLEDLAEGDSCEAWPKTSTPLSLLSPNIDARKTPSRKLQLATDGGRAADVTAAGEDEEEEPLGALPQFGSRQAGGGRRRPDPRRQSLALSSLFAATTAGQGLLGDSELAVGDDDIQVPLAKMTMTMHGGGGGGATAAGGSQSAAAAAPPAPPQLLQLFVEPNTEELAGAGAWGAPLPSPVLPLPGDDDGAAPPSAPRQGAAAPPGSSSSARRPSECGPPSAPPVGGLPGGTLSLGTH